MVTVKIYGMPMATCTKRVIVICKELDIKYELIHIDLFKGEQKNPEYIESKNPFGVVPVMVDEDGTQLFESRGICRYLVFKYGKDSGLLPSLTDAKAYGLFEQAASIEYSSFDPSAFGIVKERVFSPMVGKQPEEGLIEQYTTTLNSKLDGYERILSKQKYLAGDNITLADLFHLPYGAHLSQVDESLFGSRKHVKRWWDDVSSRPAWVGVH